MKGDAEMRKRCNWETVAVCKMYALQYNDYEEVRITLFGKAWKSFKGYNAHADAKSFWKSIVTINGR